MFDVQFPYLSNGEDWAEAYQLQDEDDNSLLDLTGCAITVTVTDKPGCGPVMQGSTDDGDVEIVSTGVFQWSFAATAVASLNAGVYDVGCRIITPDGETVQLFLGKLPVKEGIP